MKHYICSKRVGLFAFSSLVLVCGVIHFLIVVYEVQFASYFAFNSLRTVSKFSHDDLVKLAHYHMSSNVKIIGNKMKTKSSHANFRNIQKPNFILVLFDDSGYADVGVNMFDYIENGRKDILSHTPYIDDLASRGLRLTNYYVTSSICTPSRASLLTGRYGQRTGIVDTIFPQSISGLPSTEITIATMLKKQK
jgi:hypothetical protein